VKILFIYPDIITKGINFCPAIHILSAVLKKEGCEVDLLHINNDYGIKYDREIINSLSFGYDLYCLTSTSFNYKYANEIAGWIRDNGRLVVLGGSHATIQPEDFEDSNFDIFCVGEGEEPMKDLINAICSNKDWTKIPNLITRAGANPVRGFLRDLNSLPFWDFDITDTKKILEVRKGWLSISFSRGCSYSCSFCINHLYKKIQIGPSDKMSDYLRRRSPSLAVQELQSLVKKFDIKFFNIDDDLLTMYKSWMKEFTSLYREKIFEPHGIKYVINARADTLTDEIVKMLAESGCKEARIGFETGNEKLRNELLGKKTSNYDLEKAFKTLDKYGVMGVAFAMIGIPGESWDTFDDTLNAIILLQPKLIRMTFLYPYKHTKIYDICVERNLFKGGEITDNRDYGSCLKFENLSDQELFCMRFLFPWFVNFRWFNDDDYFSAMKYFTAFPLNRLEKEIPEIIEMDQILSKKCNHPHYRYYSGNEYYFELCL
jgi:anaerobic magnesium-protoporphyrin IX monomethyl ester cyclase